MSGKFTVAEKLEIISIAEKHGNVAAADEFECGAAAVRKIRKLKEKLLKDLENAVEKDKERDLRRNFAVKQEDGSVKKEEKFIWGHVRTYLNKRFVNESVHGRRSVS